jgi:hypothetical protein
MQIEKIYRVVVKAYSQQEVPKYTKFFDDENSATTYKDELSGFLWNTPVNIEIETVYIVEDGNKKFILQGHFVDITN